VRATNWVGDAVMSLPALAAVRARFPRAHIAVLARPWVAGLYRREPFADEIIAYQPKGLADRWAAAKALRGKHFDCALLLQNAFDAALVTWLARIPRRIGYARDGRALLLTDAVAVPRVGEIPAHESFYYLELLRRVGWVEQLPAEALVRLQGVHAEPTSVIGVSPGAAFGTAKRWIPERFAEAAATLALEYGCQVELYGSGGERELCDEVRLLMATRGVAAVNTAGQTTLDEFIGRAARCCLFLTNDSGSMHIASALGVPTVAIFGATNPITTGPTGPLARVVRQMVDCAPCQLRECPIDHRCMFAVDAAEVVQAGRDLLQQSGWTRAPRS
jgi:heptosyltransferase-2